MYILNKIKNKAISYLSHSSWYDAYWGGVTKFWYNMTFNIDVVNLGSNSGKYAFSYERLKLIGQNWAIGPQSLQHDFNILKNYFSYLKQGAVVFITLCPFSCLKTVYNKQHNLKYYTFLHPATIIDFDESERVKALTIKSNPVKAIPWVCIRQILKSIIMRCLPKRQSYIDYNEHASYFIDMWQKQFNIENLNAPLNDKHRQEQEERSRLLSEMIDFCIEREIKPVLVIPPVHPSLSSKLSGEFRQNYIYDFVAKSNSKNVPFLDYMDDKRFSKDGYFRNSFFMNGLGAKNFTNVVLEDIGIL